MFRTNPAELGHETPVGPNSVIATLKSESVVEATGAALPKLRALRYQAIASPMPRTGNVIGIETIIVGHQFLQSLSTLQGLALLRSPGPQLRLPRATGEVLVREFSFQTLHRPPESNLSLQGLPPKDHRGKTQGFQLTSLAALIVGKESKPTVIDTLEQNHPAIGNPSRVRRAETDGVSLRDLGGDGLL